jgi:inhibitor of KinA sporulation pathway (predicted exonuclease)
MRYVIADLEATCWESGTSPSRMEIIEIGAVNLASAAGEVTGQFGAFVRPVVEPIPSDFCVRLTGIEQSDVNHADTFAQALRRLNIPLEGRHHRAIDDALNIAKIAVVLLPHMGIDD